MESIPEEYRAQIHMQVEVTRLSVLLGDGSEVMQELVRTASSRSSVV